MDELLVWGPNNQVVLVKCSVMMTPVTVYSHACTLSIIPNMLEILDQLPGSYLAFAGRLSEITACAMPYGIEGAGRQRYTFFAHAQ
jgi:hypothetical protein